MKISLLAVGILLLVGCAIHPINGFYEGRDAADWKHSTVLGSGGVNFYEIPAEKSLNLSVTFSTSQKGSIYMNISMRNHAELDFIGSEVVVSFPDGTRKSVGASAPLLLDVSASDEFRVSLPSFRAGGVLFPPLNADFKWNPATRYYTRGLQ